ncbi:N-acetylmuramoyl-L-alanine amidase [Clostridiaceae bacterium 14S0207]|nr:N-acetylmuramoyl-L-alanine amidase [Clostridiaceae bacterium 14S0207]
MKIGLDAGHCRWGADIGARGCGMKEEEMTRTIANQVSRKLQALGHTVIICNIDKASTLEESLSHRYNTANRNNVDFYVSIHINGGGGKGSEIFTMYARELPQAKRTLDNLVKLGFTRRGIKNAMNYNGRGGRLSVIRNTHAPAMLVEVCFIDTQSDVNLYKQLGSDKIADAIVKGIVGETISTPKVSKPQPKTNNNSKFINLDGKTGICTGEGVRIRSSKSTKDTSNVIGSLNKGDNVNLYRKEGDWIHIYYPKSGGYVYYKYIKF